MYEVYNIQLFVFKIIHDYSCHPILTTKFYTADQPRTWNMGPNIFFIGFTLFSFIYSCSCTASLDATKHATGTAPLHHRAN